MAASNIPAVSPRLARMGTQGAESGLSAGRARSEVGSGIGPGGRGGGGGGANPLAKPLGGSGDTPFFQTQDVPVHGLGTALLSAAMHPIMVARADEEAARYKEQVFNPKQKAIADGVDAYSQQLQQQAGNPRAALMSMMQTPAGHALFGNPEAFQAVLGMHNVASQLATDPNPPPQVVDIGHRLLAVQVGGKWSVQKTPEPAKAGATERPIKGPDGQLYTRDPTNPTILHPMSIEQAAPQGSGGSYDAHGQYQPPAGANKAPEHFGTGKMLAAQGNFLTAAPDVYQGLQVLGALSGKATGLPTGFLQHLGGVYAGVNDPAALWDIAKRQVENGAAKLYAGGGGGAPGTKEFISNLPNYNEAPRFNVALSNNLQRSLYNETKSNAALAEQRIGGSLPLPVQQQLEPMGIYATSKQARDPWQVLKNNPNSLTDDQVEHMWGSDRLNHSPEEQKALMGEVDRRLQAAQAQPQPQAAPQQQRAPAAPLAAPPLGGPAPPLSPDQAASRYLSGQGNPQSLMQGLPGGPPAAPVPGQPTPIIPAAPVPTQPPGTGDSSGQGIYPADTPYVPAKASALSPIGTAQAAEGQQAQQPIPAPAQPTIGPGAPQQPIPPSDATSASALGQAMQAVNPNRQSAGNEVPLPAQVRQQAALPPPGDVIQPSSPAASMNLDPQIAAKLHATLSQGAAQLGYQLTPLQPSDSQGVSAPLPPSSAQPQQGDSQGARAAIPPPMASTSPQSAPYVDRGAQMGATPLSPDVQATLGQINAYAQQQQVNPTQDDHSAIMARLGSDPVLQAKMQAIFSGALDPNDNTMQLPPDDQGNRGASAPLPPPNAQPQPSNTQGQ